MKLIIIFFVCHFEELRIFTTYLSAIVSDFVGKKLNKIFTAHTIWIHISKVQIKSYKPMKKFLESDERVENDMCSKLGYFTDLRCFTWVEKVSFETFYRAKKGLILFWSYDRTQQKNVISCPGVFVGPNKKMSFRARGFL